MTTKDTSTEILKVAAVYAAIGQTPGNFRHNWYAATLVDGAQLIAALDAYPIDYSHVQFAVIKGIWSRLVRALHLAIRLTIGGQDIDAIDLRLRLELSRIKSGVATQASQHQSQEERTKFAAFLRVL